MRGEILPMFGGVPAGGRCSVGVEFGRSLGGYGVWKQQGCGLLLRLLAWVLVGAGCELRRKPGGCFVGV